MKKKVLKTKKRKVGRPRKNKVENNEVDTPKKEVPIQSETLRGIWAILSVGAGMFFMLAWFNYAGKVGNVLHVWLSALFGVGYALIPISFALLAMVLFRSIEKEKISVLKMVGTGIFFFSGLALIETLFPNQGGFIGKILSFPLIYAIDTIATIVTLFTLIVISLLIAFDTHLFRAFPTIARLLGKIPEENEHEHVLEEDEEATIDVETARATNDQNSDAEEEEDSEKETQKKSGGIFTFGTKDSIPSVFSFATGNSDEYSPPPLSILNKDKGKPSVGDVKASANTIKRTLQNFGINVEMDEVSIGPTVTRYAMKPAEGVRLAKIMSLQSNLELALATTPIRIEAPIPGKSLVGIEVPNTTKSVLGLAALLSHSDYQNSEKPLLVALGRDISGKPHYANIAKMPHLLIAGATGAGKSVTVHDIIMSLLYRKGPRELRFIMVDPKRVELTLYNDIPHLLTPVVTNPKKAILALKWLAKEMDRRYDVLEAEKVRDIDSYHKNIFDPAVKKSKDKDNENLPEPMPYIVIIIDEMADLMTAYPRELESAVVRLAQMSRAVGIHLVLSTQRPSVQVITGLIKANIPSRLALQVSSQIDSRTILDMGGAEKLLGAGDMLFLSGEMSKPRRIQAPFVTEEEVKDTVKYLSNAYKEELPDEIDLTEIGHDNSIFSSSVGDTSGTDNENEDNLYEEAKQIIIDTGKGSTSFLQRKLRIGYARAARLIDMLEERGIVGPQDGSKAREVISQETEESSSEPTILETGLIDDTEVKNIQEDSSNPNISNYNDYTEDEDDSNEKSVTNSNT